MNALRNACRLGGVATALSLLVASGTAAARPEGGNRTRHVAFASTVEVVGGDIGCDPTMPTRCAGTFRSVSTFTGDLAGTSYVVGSAVLLPDGTYQGQDVAQFSGTVAGCGSGTLIMIETGILDPTNGHQTGTWEIVAGQGAGGLAGVSGSGTSDTQAGGASGTIRCG